MRDAIAFIDHLDYRPSAQLAGIERLATRRGIKRRAIQIDALPVRTRVYHASPEFGEITIVIIEPLCHWALSLGFVYCTTNGTESLSTLFTRNSVIVLLPLEMPAGIVTLI